MGCLPVVFYVYYICITEQLKYIIMNTIGGPNKKSGTQKYCVDTGVELIPGVNCYASQYKRHIYISKEARKARAKLEHVKYYALPHWRDKKKEYVKDYRSEEKPGVYFIRYYDQIIYIGESKTPIARRVNHFSKYKNKNNYQNPIQLALLNGELDRRHLSFEVIVNEDDDKKRKEIEADFIKIHQPIYNTKMKKSPRKNLDTPK